MACRRACTAARSADDAAGSWAAALGSDCETRAAAACLRAPGLGAASERACFSAAALAFFLVVALPPSAGLFAVGLFLGPVIQEGDSCQRHCSGDGEDYRDKTEQCRKTGSQSLMTLQGLRADRSSYSQGERGSLAG